ncbi:hypothetical protein [Oceanivirga miroungae]|uniref:Uncharacterized protein n=1 Tax=Oceanivirga miroungae TaxID=1130046 RepID=A0A6I8M737_9FUSO|nr:hypothetical protein [Oceanivirga miroungae]VWL85317.1 hypothetical protein OMES3154_00601 [Oceanivirga miroungae]
MKKFFLTILLVIALISAYRYNMYLDETKNNVSLVYTKNTETKKEDEVSIKVYNIAANKIEDKNILVKDKRFLSETDIVNETLKNLSYLTNNMRLISIYEIDKNDRLIILSDDFKNLSRVSQVATTTVIKLNLKENFKKIDKIEIKFER